MILLEDEAVLREELTEYFMSHGHAVDSAGRLAEFQRMWVPGAYQLALLDLGLPDGDGMDLIAELRRGDHDIGIIVFTARANGRAEGLEVGADHYVTKPVRLAELLATVNALGRRVGYGSELWVLDQANLRLRSPKGGDISLSGHDFFVVRALLAAQGRPVSRRQLVTAIGEDYLHFDQRRLDTQMSRLKKKVRDACDLDLPIKSVHGVGYIFSGRAMVKEG